MITYIAMNCIIVLKKLFLALLNLEDPTLQFMNHQTLDASFCIEISAKEYLLLFNTIGLYVDSHGKRSRTQELMYPSLPTSFGKLVVLLSSLCII